MFVQRIASDAGAVPASTANLAPAAWPAIVNAMIAEVSATASEEQAQGFFRTLGQHIAATVRVDDIENLDTLSDRVNSLWDQLGLGHAAMALSESGIDVHHDGVPAMPPAIGDNNLWLSAIGPLLEGAYDCWFRAMGSGIRLRTRVVHRADGIFDLRHAP